MRPFFSIVIPSRNNSKKLKYTIDSLRKLDYPRNRFEVIIVDSSDDETGDILNKLSAINFHIFKNPNRSRRNSNISRNIGIKKARYENIVFLDSDCIVDKNWLRDYSNYVDNDIAGGNLTVQGKGFFSDYLSHSLRHLSRKFKDKKIITLENFHKETLPLGANFFAKKSVLNNISRFDEKAPSFEETELFYRAVKKGYKILKIPGANVKTIHFAKFDDVIRNYMRLGRGLGYFIIKHNKSEYARRKILTFLLLDLLVMAYILFLGINFSYAIYVLILASLALLLYYKIFVHRRGYLEIPMFAIL